MKYRIIASVIVLVIIVLALALKGCGNASEVDENGLPIQNIQQ